jgi:hypothetical protein
MADLGHSFGATTVRELPSESEGTSEASFFEPSFTSDGTEKKAKKKHRRHHKGESAPESGSDPFAEPPIPNLPDPTVQLPPELVPSDHRKSKGYLKKSHIEKFFDLARPELLRTFSAKEVSHASLSVKESELRMTTESARTNMISLGSQVRILEGRIAEMNARTSTLSQNAAESLDRTNRLNETFGQYHQFLEDVNRVESSFGIPIWIGRFIAFVVWLFMIVKRIIVAPFQTLEKPRAEQLSTKKTDQGSDDSGDGDSSHLKFFRKQKESH